jgi:four helix bundle protein
MNERTQQLLDRTFMFGVKTLKFLKGLPEDPIYKVPKIQVARSSGSIGANYEEAQGASSKKDFNNRITIVYREARESHYWLRVLKELYEDDVFKSDFEKFIQEADELKRIFASIKLSSKGSM